MFISPKRKNTILEMALKPFIISKLDHQLSKSWKLIARHVFETNLIVWKTEYLIAQLRTGFRQKLFRLKTCPQGVLSSELVWLKILHLSALTWNPSTCFHVTNVAALQMKVQEKCWKQMLKKDASKRRSKRDANKRR